MVLFFDFYVHGLDKDSTEIQVYLNDDLLGTFYFHSYQESDNNKSKQFYISN